MAVKGIIKAEDIVQPKLKIAIVGDTGIGKSWLATSIAADDHQVIDLDFDGRAASLAGKKNVFVKSYVDLDTNKPTAMSELESDLNEWEYDYSMNKLQFKTFIIDSGSYMRKATEREIIRQQPTLSRGIKIGTKVIRIGQGYDVFNGNVGYFEHVLARIFAIGNLIVTFHERNEKDEVKSTQEKKVFTGMVTIDPQHLNGVLSTFDDVWRLTTDYASKRILITGLVNDFAGKTTLKGLLPEEPEPTIPKLFQKHKDFIAKNGK